jgi:uncharacterized protein (TIGR00369 family)
MAARCRIIFAFRYGCSHFRFNGDVSLDALPSPAPRHAPAGNGIAKGYLNHYTIPQRFSSAGQKDQTMISETETARGFHDRLHRLYEERLPFNRLLGLRVTSVNSDGGTMAFTMREDLIGNVFHGTLHGGVISSVLDAVGGLTASASLVVRAAGLSAEKVKAMFAQVGTIDLRVDYLRPGRGEQFTASGRIMRSGRKVAVVRMEMHNEDALLVAVGTGTYMVG